MAIFIARNSWEPHWLEVNIGLGLIRLFLCSDKPTNRDLNQWLQNPVNLPMGTSVEIA